MSSLGYFVLELTIHEISAKYLQMCIRLSPLHSLALGSATLRAPPAAARGMPPETPPSPGGIKRNRRGPQPGELDGQRFPPLGPTPGPPCSGAPLQGPLYEAHLLDFSETLRPEHSLHLSPPFPKLRRALLSGKLRDPWCAHEPGHGHTPCAAQRKLTPSLSLSLHGVCGLKMGGSCRLRHNLLITRQLPLNTPPAPQQVPRSTHHKQPRRRD